MASIINVNRKYLIQSNKSLLPAIFGIKTKSNANNMIAPTSLTTASRLLFGFSKLTYFRAEYDSQQRHCDNSQINICPIFKPVKKIGQY